MKVDYHIHTLCSDGVFTVKEVIDKALQLSIKSISITDHDTIAGIREAKEYCENKIEYTAGIEITCREYSFEIMKHPLSIHLLGYGFNEKDKNLNLLLEERGNRVKKCFLTLLDDLKKYGLNIKLEDIPISCGTVLQLCDIENYILKLDSCFKEQAISYVNSYVELLSKANISLINAIDTIHRAGGKVVWAHPFTGYQRFKRARISKEEVSNIIVTLKSYGVGGIEANYLDFSVEEQLWLQKIAERNKLFYTAGSDFHGLPGRCRMGVSI